jgi:hypothetical protein
MKDSCAYEFGIIRMGCVHDHDWNISKLQPTPRPHFADNEGLGLSLGILIMMEEQISIMKGDKADYHYILLGTIHSDNSFIVSIMMITICCSLCGLPQQD